MLLNFVCAGVFPPTITPDNFYFGFKELLSYNLRQKPILGIKGDVVTFILY